MKDEDIYAGQLVTIRQWKDMATEFAELKYLSGRYTMQSDAYIGTPGRYFLSKMRYLCGKTGRVSSIRFSDYEPCVLTFADLDIERPDKNGKWYITSDMVEHLPMENQL